MMLMLFSLFASAYWISIDGGNSSWANGPKVALVWTRPRFGTWCHPSVQGPAPSSWKLFVPAEPGKRWYPRVCHTGCVIL